MKHHPFRAGLPALLLASLVLGGCASLGVDKTPEQIVAERAAARWNAIIASKWEDAYAYTTPGYRATNSVEAYQARSQNAAIRREAVEVPQVECAQPDACTATLLLTYRPLMPGYPSMSTRVTERWILDAGKWYIHLPL